VPIQPTAILKAVSDKFTLTYFHISTRFYKVDLQFNIMPVKCLLSLLLLLTLFTAKVAAQQATGVTYRKISNTRIGNVTIMRLE
jgi:hypothetical protein